MIGPPGSGKTMIAKRMRTILPEISKDEMIEVSKIYSSIGLIDSKKGIIDKRPFIPIKLLEFIILSIHYDYMHLFL